VNELLDTVLQFKEGLHIASADGSYIASVASHKQLMAITQYRIAHACVKALYTVAQWCV